MGIPWQQRHYPPRPPNPTWQQGVDTHITRPDPQSHEGEAEINEMERAIVRSQLPKQFPPPNQGMAVGGIADAYRAAKEVPHFDAGGSAGLSAMLPYFGRQAEHEIIHEGGLLESEIPGRTDHIPLSVAAGSYVMPADVVSGLGEGNSLAGARVMNHALGMGPYGSKPDHMHREQTVPFAHPLPVAQPPPTMEKGEGVPKVRPRAHGGALGREAASFHEGMPPGGDKYSEHRPFRAPGGPAPPGDAPQPAGPQPGGGGDPPHSLDIHGKKSTVPVVVAGGEFIVPPRVVAHHPKLGGGDPNEQDPKRREAALKRGHDTLDAFVKSHRAQHIKTLQKLPGPAK
jgi:hypothetical protein